VYNNVPEVLDTTSLGWFPTEIVSVTVLVFVSITEIEFPPELVTYISVPVGLDAMLLGPFKPLMVVVTALVVVFMTEIEFPP